MIWWSFVELSSSAFPSLYNTLVQPHLEYVMQACSPNLVADADFLEQIQRLATRLLKGVRWLTYEERLRRLGLHFLNMRRLRGDLIGLRGHPCKILQGPSRGFRRKLFFFKTSRKLWNGLPISIATAFSVSSFKRHLDSAWEDLFP